MLSNTGSSEILCTTCRKRRAFYYRQSSGEKLCSICLEESLENHIKHSFSRRVKLGNNPVITAYIPTKRVLEGFLLAYMLTKIEKRFGGVVSLISSKEVLNAIKDKKLDTYLEKNKNIRYGVFEEATEETECFTIKSLEKALKNLKENPRLVEGTQAILLPFTLTDLNEAFLEHVILGIGDLNVLRIGETLINDIPLILPYAQVDRVDVIALSHALRFIELLDVTSTHPDVSCGPSKIIKDLVIQVTLKHPELTRTMLKSVKFFSL